MPSLPPKDTSYETAGCDMQTQRAETGRMQREAGRLAAESADLRAQLSSSKVEARQLQATLRQLQTDSAQKDSDDLEAKVVGPLDQWRMREESVQPAVQASETTSLEVSVVNAGTKYSLQDSNKEDMQPVPLQTLRAKSLDYRHALRGFDKEDELQTLRSKSLDCRSALQDSEKEDKSTGPHQKIRAKSSDSGLATMVAPQMPEIASAASIASHDDCNVEAYWPDLGVWLPAKLVSSNADGTCTVMWEEDGSSSILPADFVQQEKSAFTHQSESGSSLVDHPARQQNHDDVVILKLSSEPASQQDSSNYSSHAAASQQVSRLSTDKSTGCSFVFCTCACICSCVAMCAIIMVVAHAWSSEGSFF